MPPRLPRPTAEALTRISLFREHHIPPLRAPHPPPQQPQPPHQRPFSQSQWLSYPRKDSQDKDSINTEATEYSKSGTDDQGARVEDPAFNPEITDPQHQKDVAEKNRGVSKPSQNDSNNPLDVSPANPDVSKHRMDNKPESSSSSSSSTSDRQRASGKSSPTKGSKVR